MPPKKLDDQLMLTDVITHLKDIMTLNGMASKESSSEEMRAMLPKLFSRTADNQFAVFSYMHKNGMYPVEPVEAKMVKQTIDKYSKI